MIEHFKLIWLYPDSKKEYCISYLISAILALSILVLSAIVYGIFRSDNEKLPISDYHIHREEGRMIVIYENNRYQLIKID